MIQPEYVGTRRELFWDSYLIDTEQTTAPMRMHQPEAKEVVLHHNAPWEGDGCNFHTILADDGLYRMYYNSWEMLTSDAQKHTTRNIRIAYAESRDGLTWKKPSLGICEFEGSTDNNIILDHNTNRFDNFFVFKDANPECSSDERYKGVGFDKDDRYLWCFTSADGIHFQKSWRMTNRGKFDTLNIAWWDKHRGEYIGFIRDFHKESGAEFEQGERKVPTGVRDVRWMTSPDFKTWSVPRRLDFRGGPDFPLYTNVVQPYYRADHIFVGFPSRYIERKEWSPNFDQLPGAERRRERYGIQPRFGLTITDCVFMCSRDGRTWDRWNEAFMRPGPERAYNWVYGDCFPAVGMIETPSHLSAAAPELSMYANENHWGQVPAELRRYALRVDGFVSRYAPYQQKCVVTKPFIFDGTSLSLNFATSAAGWLKIKLVGQDRSLHSAEMFGDSLDRTVIFEDGDVKSLAGTPVTMEMTMSDADVYAFKFNV